MSAPLNILQKFADQAAIQNPFSFREFSRIALFDSKYGYYQRARERVGLQHTTDFYTSTSIGSIFGTLIVAAVQSLLPDALLSEYTLVEIGNEPGKDAFTGVQLPFKTKVNIPLGDCIRLPEKAIVFANEVLDAQPFHRLVLQRGQWHEIGVAYRDGTLRETLLPQPSASLRSLLDRLPRNLPEGYHLDISLDAEHLLQQIASSVGSGLLICMDYGKYWEELLQTCPQGTARAYRLHQQKTNLLADPGEQDLTTHVCWDRLVSVLQANRWDSIRVHRQESFFIHYSQPAIQKIVAQQPGQFDPDRQALLQLIHPTHMGHAFQVLTATRM